MINIILVAYLIEFTCSIFIGVFFLIYARAEYIDDETKETRNCVVLHFLFVFSYFLIVLVSIVVLVINVWLAANIAHRRRIAYVQTWVRLSCFQGPHLETIWCIYTGSKFVSMCIAVIFLAIKSSTKIGWILLVRGIFDFITWLILKPLKLLHGEYNSEMLTQCSDNVEEVQRDEILI